MPSFDGDEPPEKLTPSLNGKRDVYVKGMRELIQRVTDERPPDLDGILDRAETLMDAQTVHLDRLSLLDMDGGSDPQAVFTTLIRAQQLPRMIHAMGEVLVQQEKDGALRPAQARCLELARELLLLTQTWVFQHRDELDDIEEI